MTTLIIIVVLLAIILAGVIIYGGKILWVEKINNNKEEVKSAPEEEGESLVDLAELYGVKKEPVSEAFDEVFEEEEELEDEEADEDAADDEQEQEDEESDKEDLPDAPVVAEEMMHDRLCDLKIGKGFFIDAQKVLDEAKEKEIKYGVMSIDFNRFRFINNLKGYSIGDYCLSNLSQEMQEIFPEGTLISRPSADHFIIVFPILSDDAIEHYCDELNKVSEKLRSDIGVKTGLRLCIGYVVTSDEGNDYNVYRLVNKANVARHCLKSSKTDTKQKYEVVMLTSNLYGENALEEYNESQYLDEIEVYLQPQGSVRKTSSTGAQMLVRWECEAVDNIVSFPSQRSSGRVPTNNLKVLYNACKLMARWKGSGKNVVPVMIHLPIYDFYKLGIDDFIARCLNEFELEPSCIAITVDAYDVRVDWNSALTQIEKIKKIGVSFGLENIDDRFDSLDFMIGLNVDFIIANGFLRDLSESSKGLTALKNLIARAKEQNLRIIFTGADSIDQIEYLKKLGVEYIQGSYCGKLMTPDEYVTSLREYVEEPQFTEDKTIIAEDPIL